MWRNKNNSLQVSAIAICDSKKKNQHNIWKEKKTTEKAQPPPSNRKPPDL